MRQEIFLYSTGSRPALGPPSLVSNGYQALSLAVKWKGHEADHSSLPNAEVKNGGAIPEFPHTSSWCGAKLIKDRDNFAFTK
jgi:hypothetical protein